MEPSPPPLTVNNNPDPIIPQSLPQSQPKPTPLTHMYRPQYLRIPLVYNAQWGKSIEIESAEMTAHNKAEVIIQSKKSSGNA